MERATHCVKADLIREIQQRSPPVSLLWNIFLHPSAICRKHLRDLLFLCPSLPRCFLVNELEHIRGILLSQSTLIGTQEVVEVLEKVRQVVNVR